MEYSGDNVHLHPPDDDDKHESAASVNGLAAAAGSRMREEKVPIHYPSIPFPSCRLVMSMMAFFGFFNAYALRVNLSVAIVAMVNVSSQSDVLRLQLASNGSDIDGQCEGQQEAELPRFQGEFNWDTHIQGTILASFFYGYIVTQILGGWLSDQFGGKWFFGGGILVTSLISFLIPVAARWHYNALVMMRVLQGLGEGAMIPSMHTLYAAWTPPAERSKSVTLIFSGTELGTITGMLLSGVLCDQTGWPSVFYVFGAIGCVWSVAWLLVCHSSPSDHPRISAAERTRIEASIGSETQRTATPWKSILTSRAIWAAAIIHFAHNWGYYTLLACLPRYMHDVLHFNIKDNGLLSSLPYIAALIVMLFGGQLADWLRAPNRLSTGVVRKIFCTAGVMLPGIFLIISGFLGCDRPLTVVTIVTAVGCSALTISGYCVNLLDLAAGHAGTLMGLTNSVATVASMLAPQVVGAVIYEESTRARWQIVFYIATGIYTLGAIVFLVFGEGEQQDWAKTSASVTGESHVEELNTATGDYMPLEEDNESQQRQN